MGKLSNRVFLIPVIMILIVSAGSFILFNIVMSNYVDEEVEASMNSYKTYYMAIDNIQSEIDELDGNKTRNAQAIKKLNNEIDLLTEEYVNTYNTITTQMVPLDDQYAKEYATDTEKQLIEYYSSNSEQVANDVIVEVDLDAASYCISTTSIRFAGSAEKKDVLIYTDISSINALIKSVNRVILMVLSIAALIALIVGLVMARSITKSIYELRVFLNSVERGDEDRDKSRIRYRELKDLADYMEQLSDERKASEKLQKTIFQNASHELRTPLMSIQGYAEGISTNVLKDHESAARIITTESKKMSDLVDEMLFISRMDENPVTEEDMTLIELRQIIEDCREEICIVGEKKGVVIIESLDGGKYFIKGDEKQITKAISNVMSNGIRYAKEKLALTGAIVDGIITIQVTDDGDGIAEADLPHIFDRFYKGEGGHFGIGLAITKDIIENHGGTIEAENLERGACFTIKLPAVEMETEDEPQELIATGMLSGDVDMDEIINSIPEEDRQL